MQNAPAGAINLALGELGFPMPEALKEKAIELLREGNPVYTPNAGLAELRQAIATDYSNNVNPNQIIVCNGAEEAVFITLMALINPGDTIAIPDPDYPAYPAISGIFEASVKRLPFMDNFSEIDWEQWEDILCSGVKAVLLSAPSNPSGFSFSAAEAVQFGEICNRNGIMVIVDEIYGRLFFKQAPISLNSYVENFIRIGGVSKSHCLSGWRLGWILAPLEIAPAMIKAKQYVSTCSHWLSQNLAVFALSQAGLQEAELIRLLLLDNHNYMLQRISKALPMGISAYHLPSASPYVMLKVEGDDLDFAAKLADKGVITVPGRAFGESAKGWIRMNYGVSQPLLSSALNILYNG
jgi:aspartate/methionine/tyrosine aminotransferase